MFALTRSSGYGAWRPGFRVQHGGRRCPTILRDNQSCVAVLHRRGRRVGPSWFSPAAEISTSSGTGRGKQVRCERSSRTLGSGEQGSGPAGHDRRCLRCQDGVTRQEVRHHRQDSGNDGSDLCVCQRGTDEIRRGDDGQAGAGDAGQSPEDRRLRRGCRTSA